MDNLTSTLVISKLIDLELISKLRTDLLRFKRRKKEEILKKDAA